MGNDLGGASASQARQPSMITMPTATPTAGPGVSRSVEADDDLDFAKKKSMKPIATRQKNEYKKVRSDHVV